MLDALDNGAATVVVAWHTDRLHRAPRELEEYVTLCEKRGVITHTVKAGELDLSTPSGRAVARTVGAWARFESEHKSDRIKAAHVQNAQRGKWRGGGRPYGWRLGQDGAVALDQAEATVIRRTVAELLAGASFGSQVKRLNAEGVLTSRGNRWNYTSLRQVITRPKNAGFSEYHGELVGQMDGWPTILTEDAWRAVCARFSDPATKRKQDNRAKWLVSGIARCGKCGQLMRSAHVGSAESKRNRPRVIYRCPGDGTTGHAARAVRDVDATVSAKVAALLARDGAEIVTRMNPREDIEVLRDESVALRGRLTEAAAAFADGAISAAQLRTVTERVEARLAQVATQLAGARNGSVLARLTDPSTVVDVWESLSIDYKRAVIKAIVDVRIHPTGKGIRFDPSLVEVTVNV